MQGVARQPLASPGRLRIRIYCCVQPARPLSRQTPNDVRRPPVPVSAPRPDAGARFTLAALTPLVVARRCLWRGCSEQELNRGHRRARSQAT